MRWSQGREWWRRLLLAEQPITRRILIGSVLIGSSRRLCYWTDVLSGLAEQAVLDVCCLENCCCCFVSCGGDAGCGVLVGCWTTALGPRAVNHPLRRPSAYAWSDTPPPPHPPPPVLLQTSTLAAPCAAALALLPVAARGAVLLYHPRACLLLSRNVLVMPSGVSEELFPR